MNTLFQPFRAKMASAQTPHYELYDEEKDIMIYGIKTEELYPEGFEITANTIHAFHQMIPDVIAKCANSSFSKKAIVLYAGGLMEVLQMRYYSTTLTFNKLFTPQCLLGNCINSSISCSFDYLICSFSSSNFNVFTFHI